MKVPKIRIENSVSERLFDRNGAKYVDLDHLYLDAESGYLYTAGIKHACRVKVDLEPGDHSCCISPDEIKNCRRNGIGVNTQALSVKKAMLQSNDVEYADLATINKLIEPEIDQDIPPLVFDAAQLMDIAKALHTHTRGKKFYVSLHHTKTSLAGKDQKDNVIFVQAWQEKGSGWNRRKVKTGQAIMIPVSIPE